jgi:hypothetical protein
VLLWAGSWLGCRETVDYNSGKTDFDPNRPDVTDPADVDPYRGDDPIVLEAQVRFPTGLDLHKKVVWRTCTPNGGVCHNNKEYPDLHTPANFAAAFGSPCNVQYRERTSVFDGCERPGDRVRFGGSFEGQTREVAWVEFVQGAPGEADDEPLGPDSPGLHIELAAPLEGDSDGGYTTASFIRSFVSGNEVTDNGYASFRTEWRVMDGRIRVVGRVQDYQVDDVQGLMEVGIVEGDPNQNGVLGARDGESAALLTPGRPEDSYLIARMRGEMHGLSIPGSRMPLANAPLTLAEMLALFCLVETFPQSGDETYLGGMINYASCSFSDDPEGLNLLGNGVTWTARIQKILEFNCGGCHIGDTPQGDLALVGDGVYERLLGPSSQVPGLDLIEPGDPDNSYLYLKLVGDDRIEGARMPYNPLTGEGELSESELGDILTWISAGAVEDQ